jgi:hypothetical protein
LEALGQEHISEVEPCASFLANGGDSITAALLAAELLRWTGQLQENDLLTAILEATFKDVCNHLLGKSPTIFIITCYKYFFKFPVPF